MIHTKEVHHRNYRKDENGDVRRRHGAKISYSSLFSIRIDAYRHVLPIEINRMLQECLEHLHILGTVDVVTVVLIIHLVDGRGIRITE